MNRFEFGGDSQLRAPVEEALARVIDPEMALDIVSLGLVYGVEIWDGKARARITMTSPACPVTEFIMDETGHELRQALGPEYEIQVDVVWDPPWSPERMSESARRAMDWG